MIKPSPKIAYLICSFISLVDSSIPFSENVDLSDLKIPDITVFQNFLESVSTSQLTHNNYSLSKNYYELFQSISMKNSINLYQEVQQQASSSFQIIEQIVPILQECLPKKPKNRKSSSQEPIQLQIYSSRYSKTSEQSQQQISHRQNRKQKSEQNTVDVKLLIDYAIEKSNPQETKREILKQIEQRNKEIKELQRKEMNLYWEVERETKKKQQLEERQKLYDDIQRYQQTSLSKSCERKTYFKQKQKTADKENCNPKKLKNEQEEIVRLRDELISKQKQKDLMEKSLKKTMSVIKKT